MFIIPSNLDYEFAITSWIFPPFDYAGPSMPLIMAEREGEHGNIRTTVQ